MWSSGKILLKPVDLMKGFGILYINLKTDNLDCESFTKIVLEHINKWDRDMYILEPLFEPDKIKINSCIYIPTIRHVLLIAHDSTTQKILYKKHLFSYYKIPSKSISNVVTNKYNKICNYKNDNIISSERSHIIPDYCIKHIEKKIDSIYTSIITE